MDMMIMDMYFYYGGHVVFLFKKWTINTDKPGLFFLCCFSSFLIAVFREFMKSKQSQIKSIPIDAAVYFLNLFLGYMLMLILMTFNFWLFCSIIIGYVVGYTFFGFAPVQVTIKTDGESNYRLGSNMIEE